MGYFTFEILMLRSASLIIRLLLRSPGIVADERILEDITEYRRHIENLNARRPGDE